MRPSLSLATLFRSPARTILTFVLLGAVSFALFMQVGEYAITRRELNNAALLYRGVGVAETTTPAEADMLSPFYIESDPRISENYTDEEKELSYVGWNRNRQQRYSLDELRYQPLTGKQIAAISRLPHIALSDTRYMTAGVSDEYLRLDEGPAYFPYTGRVVVEGTLREVIFAKPHSRSIT